MIFRGTAGGPNEPDGAQVPLLARGARALVARGGRAGATQLPLRGARFARQELQRRQRWPGARTLGSGCMSIRRHVADQVGGCSAERDEVQPVCELAQSNTPVWQAGT